jgi:hypothetical protein
MGAIKFAVAWNWLQALVENNCDLDAAVNALLGADSGSPRVSQGRGLQRAFDAAAGPGAEPSHSAGSEPGEAALAGPPVAEQQPGAAAAAARASHWGSWGQGGVTFGEDEDSLDDELMALMDAQEVEVKAKRQRGQQVSEQTWILGTQSVAAVHGAPCCAWHALSYLVPWWRARVPANLSGYT